MQTKHICKFYVKKKIIQIRSYISETQSVALKASIKGKKATEGSLKNYNQQNVDIELMTPTYTYIYHRVKIRYYTYREFSCL